MIDVCIMNLLSSSGILKGPDTCRWDGIQNALQHKFSDLRVFRLGDELILSLGKASSWYELDDEWVVCTTGIPLDEHISDDSTGCATSKSVKDKIMTQRAFTCHLAMTLSAVLSISDWLREAPLFFTQSRTVVY